MNVLEKIVKKQDELIRHLRLFALTNSTAPFTKQWNEKRTKIESELSALKAMEGEEVSDEDIKVWALCKSPESVLHYAGLVEGAKAHRDGLIPASGKAQIKEQKCKRKQDNSDGICPDCGKDHYEGRSV